MVTLRVLGSYPNSMFWGFHMVFNPLIRVVVSYVPTGNAYVRVIPERSILNVFVREPTL